MLSYEEITALVAGVRGAGCAARAARPAASRRPGASCPCWSGCCASSTRGRHPDGHRAEHQRPPPAGAGGAPARGRRRSPECQRRLAGPREVPAHHPPRRPFAGAGRHRSGAGGRFRIDQAEHRRARAASTTTRWARSALWAWARDLVPRFIEEMPMADGRTYLPGALLSGGGDPRAGGRAGSRGGDRRRRRRHRAGGGPARYFRLHRPGARVRCAGSGSSRR